MTCGRRRSRWRGGPSVASFGTAPTTTEPKRPGDLRPGWRRRAQPGMRRRGVAACRARSIVQSTSWAGRAPGPTPWSMGHGRANVTDPTMSAEILVQRRVTNARRLRAGLRHPAGSPGDPFRAPMTSTSVERGHVRCSPRPRVRRPGVPAVGIDGHRDRRQVSTLRGARSCQLPDNAGSRRGLQRRRLPGTPCPGSCFEAATPQSSTPVPAVAALHPAAGTERVAFSSSSVARMTGRREEQPHPEHSRWAGCGRVNRETEGQRR